MNNKIQEFNISIVGLGTVGSNVVKSIENLNNKIINKSIFKFNIAGLSAKDKNKKRIFDLSQYQWFENPLDLVDKGKCDILIELVGNQKGLSYDLIKKAIQNKIHVVTANKALLANYGNELFNLAYENKVQILFEAAVAGGIPIINILNNSLFLNRIKNIYGILNGTTNFILTEMEKNNINFENALKIASEKGYAEADSTNDIEGIDSAYKITLLASLCFKIKINHEYSYHLGINNFKKEDIKYSKKLGYRIKLVSEASIIDEKIFISTTPKLISINSSLANVEGVLNAVNIQTDHLKSLFIEGEGAGGIATSSSILADLFEIAKFKEHTKYNSFHNLKDISCYNRDNIKSAFYLRLLVKDQPGVLSKITTILTSENISIQTILQLTEEKINNKVPIILTTYEIYEKKLKYAISEIAKENFLEDDIVTLTIQN